MSEKPELLPCPFCGATMEDWHGQSFTHPLVETREEACILAGLSFSYQHSRWNTEEVLRWNRRAALSDHPTVKALVDADADLLLDSYKALLVLRRALDKASLTRGAETAKSIADRIVAAHPEIPGRAAIRKGETT